MKLQVERNTEPVKDKSILGETDRVIIMTTPPIGIDPDYWLFRVQLSPTQAIVAFPKFAQVGIGFEREEDWNTNLPSRCDAAVIFEHIKHNKGDASITDADCITAIEMIQAEIAKGMN